MSKEYAKKFYNSKQWKMCRASYIESVNGLCERCLESGRYTPGYIVHHKQEITPMNINDPDITLNHDNFLYVCMECHNYIHYGKYIRREDVGFDENGELIKIN